ncbi:MAG: LysR family transcriptional regulator [Gemmataceae bacterium]
MQFEALKVYCDVARLRSFTQAAAANGMSQSAASQIVHLLEERMGVQLIDRSTRPLQVTALGKAYYEGCKQLVEQYLELEASIRQAQLDMAAHVHVAAIYSVGLGDMEHLVEQYLARHPATRIHIEYLHPERVYQKVQDGDVDFGLVSFPRSCRELTVLSWRDEEMVVTCAPGHSLARQRLVTPAQLAGEKFIGFNKDLVIRREVDRFLRKQGVSVEVVLEFDNVENIKKAVEISAGVALLPEPTLRHEVHHGTLIALPLANCRLVRPLGIIHRRHAHLSDAALGFIQLLRQQETLPAAANNGTPHASANKSASGRGRKARLSLGK